MGDLVGCCARVLAICWRQDRRRTILAVLLMLLGIAALPLTGLGLRWLVNSVVAGRGGQALVAGLVTAALTIAALTLAQFANIAYFELSDLCVLHLQLQLIEVSNGSAGLAHHEQPEFNDKLTVAQQEVQQFSQGVQAVLTAAALVLSTALTAALLALLHPVLVLLVLLVVPALLTGRYGERLTDRVRLATAEATREAQGLFRLTSRAEPAKELRVLRLASHVYLRHQTLWTLVADHLSRAHLVSAAVRSGGQALFAVGYVCGLLLILRDALAGRRSVGDVLLAITLAALLNQQLAGAVSLWQSLQRMAGTFRLLAELRSAVKPAGQPSAGAPPYRLDHGIQLVGVSFAYPGAREPVLRDVNLTLPAGATVAVVGENGAGKSSLVKLLCGFYQPTGGRILVDGLDLSRMSMNAWRQRIAVTFQDFVRFELEARQTVGIGDLPRLAHPDADVAVHAAIDRARAGDVLLRLENGLDTQLGGSQAAGVELSGGQWQKLALARGFMREHPLLLVLDEPASALDAEAEHELLELYAAQARQLARQIGTVTVLISHRFSTVRSADLIIVVDKGRIVEAADHATLLRSGGLYAELYQIQARAYS